MSTVMITDQGLAVPCLLAYSIVAHGVLIRVTSIAEQLGTDFALIHKERKVGLSLLVTLVMLLSLLVMLSLFLILAATCG